MIRHPSLVRAALVRAALVRAALAAALVAPLLGAPAGPALAQASGHAGHDHSGHDHAAHGHGAKKAKPAKAKPAQAKPAQTKPRRERTGRAAPAPAPEPASTREYRAGMDRMHGAMAIPYTGDANRDFAAGMIPHHEGAIDMAETLLRHGDDPVLRRLALGIIQEQRNEIAQMRAWLDARERRGPKPYGAGAI